jgi:ribosomal protein L40E
MSNESQGAQWICASCGARHEERNPPCTSCAGEEFAKLEASSTDRIEQSADVAWICEDCGTRSPRNNTACKECGGFQYAQLANGSNTGTEFEGDQTSSARSSPPASSSNDTQFYIGIVVGVAGVVLIPYFLFLVAIPESIGSFFGYSTLDVLGRDTRENDFMRGSFMIIRWFGHFLVGSFIVGFVIGLLLVL